MIYLGIPYTFHPELSNMIANAVTAHLMNKGEVVYSPISHGHAVAEHLDPALKVDHEFWMKQCVPMINVCSSLTIVRIHGLDEPAEQLIYLSRGLQREIKEAAEKEMPITYINYSIKNGRID